MKRLWLSFLILLLIVASLPSKAAAQTDSNSQVESGRSLSISPAIFDAVVEPGQTVQKELYIHNTTDQLLPIRVEPRYLDPIEDVIDINKIGGFNAAEWITVEEPYHIMEGRERLKIIANIAAPDDAEPGGHYATINIEVLEPVASRNKTGATVAPRVGIHALVTVPGPAERKLSITDHQFIPRFISSEIVRLSPRFENTGTIHVAQNTRAVFHSIFAPGVSDIALPPRIILPNTTKEVNAVWQNVPFFGVYRVTVEGSHGPAQEEVISHDEVILVFRWLPFLVLGIPLVLIGWFISRTHRRWGKAIKAFRKNK